VATEGSCGAARSLLRAHSQLGALGADRDRDQATSEPSGLSTRERQIAELVAVSNFLFDDGEFGSEG
jgi:hypothetical protein